MTPQQDMTQEVHSIWQYQDYLCKLLNIIQKLYTLHRGA